MILIVGSGEGGVGALSLEHERVITVNSDVAITDRTDLCLDGHDIPFESGTFDGVVVQAVLEHVVDPNRCVEEIHRVLKPGGIVYAETPFMQQVHMGAHDFTRFTPLGHRRLFRKFDQIDAGIAVGPGSALAWSLVYLMASFAKSSAARGILTAIGRFSFFWLKYLDRFLNDNASSYDAASGVYFIGRRRTAAIPDDAILESYVGGLE